ncbi:hypothetical protein FACS1894103_1870 [Campylobacterota bacterium]|nr:hypothetical protein FACS1894103_1870 [Campylobacterota bacterium]
MTRSFTLIEVIIAALIASLAALATLNVSIESTKVGSRLKSRQELHAPVMFAAMHGKSDYANTEHTLSALLAGSYKIDNEVLKNYLETKTVFYTQTRISGWEAVPSDIADGYNTVQFDIVEKSIKMGDRQARVYTIEPLP